jgi:hypothetical protein
MSESRPVRVARLGLLVMALAAAAAGCAKARAESAPEGPALEMPAPPPRVLAPLEEPLPVTVALPEAPPTVPAAPARPPARRAGANGSNGATAEAETRPEPAPPAPAVVQAPPEPVPTETRELRAAPTAGSAAAERNVRDLLARAARDLARVDYGRLSADGKLQYEQSKRFTQQAEEALKDRNLVFATTLADKAATLAAELPGR